MLITVLLNISWLLYAILIDCSSTSWICHASNTNKQELRTTTASAGAAMELKQQTRFRFQSGDADDIESVAVPVTRARKPSASNRKSNGSSWISAPVMLVVLALLSLVTLARMWQFSFGGVYHPPLTTPFETKRMVQFTTKLGALTVECDVIARLFAERERVDVDSLSPRSQARSRSSCSQSTRPSRSRRSRSSWRRASTAQTRASTATSPTLCSKAAGTSLGRSRRLQTSQSSTGACFAVSVHVRSLPDAQHSLD